MRQPWIVALLLLVAVIIAVPSILAGRSAERGEPARRPRTTATNVIKVSLFLPDRNQLVQLGLEDYVAGVVAGEMPGSFHLEAKKAQAVLARTYALRRMRAFGGQGCPTHPEADLCADTQHQVYTDLARLRAREGWIAASTGWREAERAGRETAGLMLVYDGEPIEAVYHSTSAGSTEDAAAVWQRPVPYLMPVASDDRSSPRYREEVRLPLAEFARRLGVTAVPAAGGRPLIAITERTAGGRVKSLRVGESVFQGTQVRERLGLRSAQFTVATERDQVVIETFGFGHGVGMSQFGANELARAGKGYRDVLAHYYRGVEITPIFTE